MKTKPTIVTGTCITKQLFKALCICILMIINYPINAQSQITLKGTVLDNETNKPLAFATVTIPESKISVISNESGAFQFHIPGEWENSNVQISYLGYKTIKLKVSEIKQEVMTTFRMIPQEQQLKEVEIKEKKSKTSAEDIVDHAIQNIRNNYPREKTLYNGYYRDYISPAWTVSYQNLIEAALVIEDRGFQSHDAQRTKIKLEQLRYNPNISIDSSFNKAYDGENKFIPGVHLDEANELAMLKAHDPIRNHKLRTFSFVYVFDFNFVRNHRFYYESITEEDSALIYGIRVECNARGFYETSEYNAIGHIFINSKTYAILKFNYMVTCYTPTYAGKFFDLKLEYKNYNDKYYLNYLSLMNYFVLKNSTSANHINKPYFQYRELFINKIVTEPFESLQREETINKEASLLTNKVPVIEGFWDHYNYTGIPKLKEEVISEY